MYCGYSKRRLWKREGSIVGTGIGYGIDNFFGDNKYFFKERE
jgi:hypothetical protein